MAVRAGFVGVPGFLGPQRLALDHEQHAGIGAVVVLDRARFGPHEGIAGAACLQRDLAGEQGRGRGEQGRHRYCAPESHSTVIDADAVDE